MQNENENENGEPQIIKVPLDGSFGLGGMVELTIITKHGDKLKEETYQIPYIALDMRKLEACNSMNLINGYRIAKITENTSSLRELGL